MKSMYPNKLNNSNELFYHIKRPSEKTDNKKSLKRYQSDNIHQNNLKFLKRLKNTKSSVVDVETHFKNEKLRA